MECLRQLQRALDYVEAHLEQGVTLEDLAREACYSRSHFAWLFRAATRLSPVDYVRRRKLTEAATAILRGADIADTAYRFGFSAQDVFTRSFRNELGLPPARFRRSGGAFGRLTPPFRLYPAGGAMRLSYNMDCDDQRAVLRIEELLSDEVLETVGRVAVAPVPADSLDRKLVADLCEADIFRVDGDLLKVSTAVFLDQDLRLIREAASAWGEALARDVAGLDGLCCGMHPDLKRYLVGYRGIDAGTFSVLLDGGYAYNHRARAGRYATAKVDLYEVSDVYSSFGGYLSGGYGFVGDRFAVGIIGADGGVYSYLQAGLSPTDERQYRFLTNANRFFADSLGALLLGESSHPHLAAAAEEAGLLKGGMPNAQFITSRNGDQGRQIVRATRAVIEKFIGARHEEMAAFLGSTMPGRQGVPASRLIVDLMRYVRMVAHRTLYAKGFFADELPEGGVITVFRERTVEL